MQAISNPALSAALTGKLLLIHGELDDNVLPAQTLRLVDALIAADKDVDMLIVRDGDHALLLRMHHVTRRPRDYFVLHLRAPSPAAPPRAVPAGPLSRDGRWSKSLELECAAAARSFPGYPRPVKRSCECRSASV